MNLDYLNINNNNYKRNSSADQLIDDSVVLKEGVIGLNGALMVDTGEFSGRIPNDKFIVDEYNSTENIWLSQTKRERPQVIGCRLFYFNSHYKLCQSIILNLIDS